MHKLNKRSPTSQIKTSHIWLFNLVGLLIAFILAFITASKFHSLGGAVEVFLTVGIITLICGLVWAHKIDKNK